MTKAAFPVCMAALAATLLFSTVVCAEAPHDRAFWQMIAKQHYAVPQGESADALAHELSALLGSPDPELRDDLAYSILATWIHRGNVLSTATQIFSHWRVSPRECQWF